MSTSLFSPQDFSKEVALSHLPLKPNVICDSVPIKGEFNANYSSVFRNKALANRMINNVHPELNTHYKLFANAAAMFKDKPCLGSRSYDYVKKTSGGEFNYLTFDEVNEKRKRIGSGFIRSLLVNPYKSHSVAHKKIDNHLRDWMNYGSRASGRNNIEFEIEKSNSFILSIFASNRMEWILTDLACSSYSITNTALYDTLGPEVTQYILQLTESPIVVCSMDKINQLLELKKKFPKELANFISIVSMDPIELISNELFKLAQELQVTIQDLNQIEELGRSSPIKELPPNPDTLYTISFTSGTTGSRPKGAMVHQSMAAAYITCLLCFEPQAGDHDKAFIFLPLTHIYERETSAFALCSGYYLGFPQLTIGKKNVNAFTDLIDDLRIFKPHYFSIVPRLLTRLEGLLKSKIKELDQSNQEKVNKIIDFKITQQAKADGSTGFDYILDQFKPYRNLREFVGFDNIKWVQTASAPVAGSTLIYLKASLNIGIRQLYGLTESGGAITSTNAYESSPGSCGSIGLTGEFKLRNARDMGYNIDELKGELLLRGPQIFKGYYYNKAETDVVFNEDGWFHTGDIASVDKKGRITIIDRVKNFFKLQQGEYISPEKIENRYLSSNPMISQLYVHGDSLKSYLVGVVGIEYEQGLKFLNQEFGYNKIAISSEELLEELNKVDIKTKFLQIMNSNVKDKLNGFEILHNIHLEINPLTVERDVVTPTFKIRRPIASKFFGKVFHKLYEIEQSLVIAARLQAAKL
ncbi:Long-chain-fatty-acid-CoA ligase [Spathaspora sp. JA1]|nr:Long-chain-fatty-acid-CoA ligase [Spathaspora sp. JA1]